MLTKVLLAVLLCGVLLAQKAGAVGGRQYVVTVYPSNIRPESVMAQLLTKIRSGQAAGIAGVVLPLSNDPYSRRLTESEMSAVKRMAVKMSVPRDSASVLAKPKASSSVGASSIPVDCADETSTCCLRELIPLLQTQLDVLDSAAIDGLFLSPKEGGDKMDVFLLDTGVDETNPFLNPTVIVEPDCVDVTDPTWTPAVDTNGQGTSMAGMIGTFLGVTPNVVLHSIKIANATATTATFTCGVDAVRSWLNSNPLQKAIVVTGQVIDASYLPAIDALVSDFGDRLVFVAADYESSSSTSSILTANVAIGCSDSGITASFGTPSVFVLTTILFDAIPLSFPGQIAPGVTISFPVAHHAAGVLAGVLAQHWLDCPLLTGNELRDLIVANRESDIHVAGQVEGVNKVLKYRCGDKCHICKNGGTLLPGKQCLCPAGTTGARCEQFVCGEECAFGHPTRCDLYVFCGGQRPIVAHCPVHSGVQWFFDVVTKRCAPPCDAQVRPGCVSGETG